MKHFIVSSVVVWLVAISSVAQAEPLHLPANAIPDDTFLVATFDATKLDPVAVEASIKASLGDKASDADSFLNEYKEHYAKYVDKGLLRVTVVVRGDLENAAVVFYVELNPGSDHEALQKQVHDDQLAEGEDWEISFEGDFLIAHEKGSDLPAAGSDERTKAFLEALGAKRRPMEEVFIGNDKIVDLLKKTPGLPPAMVTVMTECKSVEMNISLGEKPKAELTLETADEETAKRVSESLETLAAVVKSEIAIAKAAAVINPQMAAEMKSMDAALLLADALKPKREGSKVMVHFDTPAVGAMVQAALAIQIEAEPSKGGL